MRLTANLLVVLLFLAIAVALTVGLVEQSIELQRLGEHARRSQCVTLQTDFSHLKFVGYHLALFVAAIAAAAYAALVGTAYAFRRIVRVLSARLA